LTILTPGIIKAVFIPTNQPPTYTATLSRVILGESGDQQHIYFDTSASKMIISGGLMVGEIEGSLGHIIDKTAINAIIAGGSYSQI
jgi:hypothetical protein